MMKAYQQPDGSFSSDYFNGPRWTGDIGLRIGTTGHTLEWLVLALPDDELEEPWLTKAVSYLCDMLDETQDYELECGGLYHAARGLKLYRERRFGKPDRAASGPASAASGDPLAQPRIVQCAECRAVGQRFTCAFAVVGQAAQQQSARQDDITKQ